MARQEPVITKDRRLQVEWVARGKYPIGLGAESPSISEFKNAGAPIREVVPIEGSGLAAGSGCIGLINKAPHPNASKLFINWFLGQEGQTVWTKAIRKASARVDVTKEYAEPLRIPIPGKTYFMSDAEDYLLGDPERMKLAREIFGV